MCGTQAGTGQVAVDSKDHENPPTVSLHRQVGEKNVITMLLS